MDINKLSPEKHAALDRDVLETTANVPLSFADMSLIGKALDLLASHLMASAEKNKALIDAASDRATRNKHARVAMFVLKSLETMVVLSKRIDAEAAALLKGMESKYGVSLSTLDDPESNSVRESMKKVDLI